MSFVQDVRYAIRVLRNSPGFAATAVITIGLGIGATTAIFSVCDALLWKPVPLPHLETLVSVVERGQGGPDDWNALTPADFTDIGRDSVNLASFAGWDGGMANLVGAGGQPERVSQALTSANFFDVVGVQPAIGRAFQPGEDEPGPRPRRHPERPPLEAALRRRPGNRRDRTSASTIENFTVIGVMPASYDFPIATEVWTPYAMPPPGAIPARAHMFQTIGRLKPGSTRRAGRARRWTVSRRGSSRAIRQPIRGRRVCGMARDAAARGTGNARSISRCCSARCCSCC